MVVLAVTGDYRFLFDIRFLNNAWIFQRPLVGPVLIAQHYGALLAFAIGHQKLQVHHWHPLLFTNGSRFSLNTCDR